MQSPTLFMILLGCTPPGRNTEQHDIFFGIGNELKDLVEDMYTFWPEADRKLHIDAWRAVTHVDGYAVNIVEKNNKEDAVSSGVKLFFINLGGYKQNEFEEYHYKILTACADKVQAIQRSKQTTFYKHTGFKGAESHVDDKYGIDVDDIFEISEILSPVFKQKYSVVLSPSNMQDDQLQLGYLMFEKLLK
ncbi:MAG: DUF1543 domain-containing protein [Agriterribacter sp.]